MGKYRMVGLPDQTARKPKVPIFSVRGTCKIAVLATSDQVTGVFVHWSREEKRPWLCQGEGCPLCAVGSSVRYRGYFAALCGPYRTHQIVELSHDAAASLGNQLSHLCGRPAEDCSIRGRAMKLFRTSDRKTAQMCCEVDSREPATHGLPLALDVPTLLVRLFEGKGRTR